METKQKAKGSWGVRFFIAALGVFLGVLFFWLLSFVEGDIGTMKGPDWEKVRSQYVPAELNEQQKELEKQVADYNRSIDDMLERKKNIYQSITNLQNTINQLLSIQRESVTKSIEFPEDSLRTLRESQAAFLEYQKEDLKYTQEISALTLRRQEKALALTAVNETIKAKEEDARKEYDKLYEKHRLKTAVLKLAFLVPVFLVVSFFFLKFRTGAYWPLVWAGFGAAFIKIALVAHEYFPSKYFKYIALLVVIGIVVRFLVYLIRMIVAPKKDLLIKQYQQHYDKCICPVCSKPIRTGPLRYIGGLGKKAQVLAGKAVEAAGQEPYTCPACGTGLYGKCTKCGGVRHTLLPYCEHCGGEKPE